MSPIKYIWIALRLLSGIINNCRSHMLFTIVESCYDPTESSKTYQAINRITVPLCGLLCAKDNRCKSISITRDGGPVTCYHNSERRLLSIGCNNRYRHFNGYHSSCHYQGVFLNGTYGCRCYGGYIGAWCERLMEDCTEGASTDHYKDYTESDVFHIHPSNSPRSFKVVCRMPRGWTFLFKRRFDSPFVNFTRPWGDYRNGFGDFSNVGNFWAGLDMVQYVTNNRPHLMRITVMFKEDGNVLWRNRDYAGFQMSSEKYSYNFTFSSTVQSSNYPAIDGISPLLGARFSTYDVDNDDDSNENCANIHQSGWWFTTCDGYNPTGQPQPPSVQFKTSDPTQMSWPHTLNYSAVKISMYVMAENN